MIAVGDSPDVFVININQETEHYDQQYQLVDPLVFPAVFPREDLPVMASSGCSFSISWNRCKTMFAVAQQYPGKVAVWEWPSKRLLYLLDMLYRGNHMYFFGSRGKRE